MTTFVQTSQAGLYENPNTRQNRKAQAQTTSRFSIPTGLAQWLELWLEVMTSK